MKRFLSPSLLVILLVLIFGGVTLVANAGDGDAVDAVTRRDDLVIDSNLYETLEEWRETKCCAAIDKYQSATSVSEKDLYWRKVRKSCDLNLDATGSSMTYQLLLALCI